MLATLVSVLVVGFGQERVFPAAPLSLGGAKTTKGETVDFSLGESKAGVLIFTLRDCPIANRYAPEVRRISEEYGEQGVKFWRVYVDSMDMAEAVEAHGRDYGYKFPGVLDDSMALVKATGVRVTPEVVVFGPDKRMLYRGRIDNQNIEHGRVRPGYRRDLRVALDEILAGQPVSVKETAAVGCFISWE